MVERATPSPMALPLHPATPAARAARTDSETP